MLCEHYQEGNTAVFTCGSYRLLNVTNKGLMLLKLVLDKALIATFTSA